MKTADWQLHTPVAFIIFYRPDTTARVFEEIRRARPAKLLVVADGPRPDRPGEAEKVAAARAIIEQVDWPCEVLKNYSDINLGCRRRVSSGLDWVFQTVEEAIILEDDCLPHPTFFRFCEELLERYRDDKRIGMISGDNFQFGRKRTKYSYYFSRHCHIWGWASWRRAWTNYDVDMRLWPEISSDNWLKTVFKRKRDVKLWNNIFCSVYDNKINTWDFQWTFCCSINHTLSIMPSVNLVSNIGFIAESTHTAHYNIFSNMKVEAMSFPLRIPPFMLVDVEADNYTMKNNFDDNINVISALIRRIGKYIKN